MVSVHWTSPTGETHLAGRLDEVGPARLQRFTYDSSWLAGPGFSLGEGLPPVSGPLLPPGGTTEFGVFLDAGPDAWGRRVIARKLRPAPRGGTGYLLAAADQTREGALRFSDTPDGDFLSDGGPEPVAQLDELHREVRAFQEDRDSPGGFARLLRAGTSQGGFRPKAAVIDEGGGLWIAKFPSETDTYDVETCEAAALAVARDAGLAVPEFRLVRVDPDRAILLVRRFDRTPMGRFGYQSMRTATRLGPDDAVDYQMMAATAGFHSGSAGVRGVVGLAALNLAINNIDDHSRNAGLLQDGDGRWTLAPVFDVVPYPGDGEGTPLAPGEDARSLEGLLDLAWGIPRREVERIASRVVGAAVEVYAVARDRFGLDEETAANLERHRATTVSVPASLALRPR